MADGGLSDGAASLSSARDRVMWHLLGVDSSNTAYALRAICNVMMIVPSVVLGSILIIHKLNFDYWNTASSPSFLAP